MNRRDFFKGMMGSVLGIGFVARLLGRARPIQTAEHCSVSCGPTPTWNGLPVMYGDPPEPTVYYLRADYFNAFWDIINWHKVDELLEF